jgi:hypothetical protein
VTKMKKKKEIEKPYINIETSEMIENWERI